MCIRDSQGNNPSVYISNNGSNPFLINSAGNVGIGTTTPTTTGLTVGQTTASTSTTTGAIVDAGGIGVTGNAYVGGVLNVGNVAFNSYAFNQGAIVDVGGLGVQGNIYAGGNNNNSINVARNNGAVAPSSIGMSAFSFVPYISYTYSGGTCLLYTSPSPRD